MKRANKVILGARVLSAVFNPFYLPTVGLIALFTFSYLSLLPLSYKIVVLGLVYIFTILLPTLLISLLSNSVSVSAVWCHMSFLSLAISSVCILWRVCTYRISWQAYL